MISVFFFIHMIVWMVFSTKGTESFVDVIGSTDVWDRTVSIAASKDNGFVVGGSSNFNTWSFIMMKYSDFGRIEWAKSLSGGSSDYGKYIVETEDGGFFGTGHTDSSGLGDLDILISKFNSTGDMQWVRTIGSPDGGIEEGYFGMETSDNDFVICGRTNGWSVSDYVSVVMKVDTVGDVVWSRKINYGPAQNILYGGYLTNDDGFVGVGATKNTTYIAYDEYMNITYYSVYDAIVVKLDPNGDLLWSKIFGSPSVDRFFSCFVTSDLGVIVVGEHGKDGLVVKLDSAGDVEWISRIGNQTAFYSVREISTGEYIIGGQRDNLGLVVLFNAAGGIEWSRVLQSEHEYTKILDVDELGDGGFGLTGEGLYNDAMTSDTVTSKIDSEGNGCNWNDYELEYFFYTDSADTNITCDDGSSSMTSDAFVASSLEPSTFVFTTSDYVYDISESKCALCVLGYDNPPACDEFECYGILSNLSTACGDFGTCEGYDECQCDEFLHGQLCNYTQCFGVLENMTLSVCSGNGDCVDLDTCECDNEWYGSTCNMSYCFGILANDSSTCSGRGDCVNTDTCSCDFNYHGDFCNVTTCANVTSNDTAMVCNGHGICSSFEICDCEINEGFVGSNCDEFITGYPFRSYSYRGRSLLRISYFMKSTDEIYDGAECEIEDLIPSENRVLLFGSASANVRCFWRRDPSIDYSIYTSRRSSAGAMNVTHFEITLSESYPLLAKAINHDIQLLSPTAGDREMIKIRVMGKGALPIIPPPEEEPTDPLPSIIAGIAGVSLIGATLFVMFQLLCVVCLGLLVMALIMGMILVFAWIYDLYGWPYEELLMQGGLLEEEEDGLTKLQKMLKEHPDDTLDDEEEEESDDVSD